MDKSVQETNSSSPNSFDVVSIKTFPWENAGHDSIPFHYKTVKSSNKTASSKMEAGDPPHERGIFFRFHFNQRVAHSRLAVYGGVGKSFT